MKLIEGEKYSRTTTLPTVLLPRRSSGLKILSSVRRRWQTLKNLLKNIIKECGCAEYIGHAHRGLTGVGMIQQHSPELVIIDLDIPGTSGFDLLIWVKETFPQTKVVIISNSLKPEYKQISESLGADYFLDKQNELNTIAEIIKTMATSFNASQSEVNVVEQKINKKVG